MCPSLSLSEITCKWSLIKNMFWYFYSKEGGDQALVDLLMRLFEEIYPQCSSLFQLLLRWLTFPCALAEGHLLCQQAGDEMLKVFWCLSCWFWQYSFHLLPSFSSCLCWMRNALFICPAVYEGRTHFLVLSYFWLCWKCLYCLRRNEHVFVLKTSKMHNLLSLLQELVKSCIRLWKTVLWNLACRSDLEHQVLTTGFPPMLMPLWFAGFGNCFCLPAFHRSPQHTEPSCDFTRCVGGRAVCC